MTILDQITLENDPIEIKIENEENTLEKSRQMLETKALYYDQVTSGQKQTHDSDDEYFLVDFNLKKEADKETIIKIGKLKLKNDVDEDDYNEQLRMKWEEQEFESKEKSSLHYQDIKYDGKISFIAKILI